MNTPKTVEPAQVRDDDEKIVNFLGIKQSWWRTTSTVHALIMDVYCVWYFIFGLQYEGGAAAIIVRASLHLLGVSGGLMFLMLVCIHTGAFLMMIHDKYREWRDGRIREEQEGRLAAEEAARVAEEARLAEEEARRAAEETARTTAETIGQIAAWNERRITAAQNGEHFDEPMPNGQPLDIVAQLEQERAAANAWYERRIAAAEKGEPFDEPPPNGANGL